MNASKQSHNHLTFTEHSNGRLQQEVPQCTIGLFYRQCKRGRQSTQQK